MVMMQWDKLLSSRRIRELLGGTQSGVNDHRTAFQSDYDRVVFSPPVKRLQDKAQVFPLEPNDAVRTRLTHSMEVSCVARGIAQRIGKELFGNGKRGNEVRARAIEDICGTAGLVHDLGNPPFGHYGESAIAEWFQSGVGSEALGPIARVPRLCEDFTKFEGNARTVRQLCHLQVLSDQHGLNLTAATLAATMKYTLQSHESDKEAKSHAHRKPGYMFSESRVIEAIHRETGTGRARHPLALLIEAADDCVYSICDIEDGVRKGILTFEGAIELLKRKAVDHHLNEALISEVAAGAKKTVDAGVRTGPRLTGGALDDAYMQMFRVRVITENVSGVCNAFIENQSKILNGKYDGELVSDKDAGPAGTFVKTCKEVGIARIYCTRPTIELELRGGHIIRTLLDKLWIGVDRSRRTKPAGRRFFSLISGSYRNIYDFELVNVAADRRHGFTTQQMERYYDLMLLTDYVGGMTDSFACALYRSLTDG